MKELYLTNCEKKFLLKVVSEGHRLDGRNYNESRKLQIGFGSEYGSCIVSLGETKVLSQVSCEVVQPKQIRPHEGLLHINVELSPMAAPQFEANRQTDISVYLNRLLEKCFKDSKCIDLESLCIVVEEKVWSLRVDIKVLNHEGNLIECCSIATLSSLAHFKRPDVTRSGDKVTIHTLSEKDPIPTVLYHYPVCTAFAIFSNEILLSDPSILEESVCMGNTEDSGRGLLVIGMNQYTQICLLDLCGAPSYNSNIVYKAMRSAADKTNEIIRIVKKAIIDDDTARQKRIKKNFSDIITVDHMLSLSRKDLTICLKNSNVDNNEAQQDIDMESHTEKPEASKYEIVSGSPQTAEIKAKDGVSAWIEISSDSEEDAH